MAFDGATWNEAIPTDSTVANEIDDYMRDLRSGVRGRLAIEHIWPSTQTATGQAGMHNYITLQAQSAAPTLVASSGQVGAIYCATSSAGFALMVVNSAGVSSALAPISGGTYGSIAICSSAAPTGLVALAGSADGYVLKTFGATAAPSWGPVLTMSGTGVTGNYTAIGGGNYGPTSAGTYYYLTMGISTADGKLMMVSGSTASGVAIPLPDGCPQANCHWLVSVRHCPSAGYAWYGYSIDIAANRVVNIYTYGVNWVN